MGMNALQSDQAKLLLENQVALQRGGTYEPQLAQKDTRLLDYAIEFCTEYALETINGQTVKVPKKVTYQDLLNAVYHYYSHILGTSYLNTSQAEVQNCRWNLNRNIMEVRYEALGDYNALSFLRGMSDYVYNQIYGGAHEGTRQKYVGIVSGGRREVTVGREGKRQGFLGRLGL